MIYISISWSPEDGYVGAGPSELYTVAAPLKRNNITKVAMIGPSPKSTTNFQIVE